MHLLELQQLLGCNTFLHIDFLIWLVSIMLQITYGAPIYRLNLLKDSCLWTIKLHVIGGLKFYSSYISFLAFFQEWDVCLPRLSVEPGFHCHCFLAFSKGKDNLKKYWTLDVEGEILGSHSPILHVRLWCLKLELLN